MKHTLIAAALSLVAGTAAANAPFDFQLQFGSEEYVHGADTASMVFAPVARTASVSSHDALYLAANVDGIAPNAFTGVIEPSGPSRISLWEVQRDSPEGIAYRQYHEKYPVGTDWDRIAREWRADRMERELASGISTDDSPS